MSGVNAFGTALKRGDGEVTEVFTTIANVTSIQGPGIERETLDVTAHDSADGWREFLGGVVDGGEIEIELNYDPAKHDALVSDFGDSEPRNYKLVFPNGAEWAVSLIMSEFEQEAPFDDKLSATITYKVSGKPTLTAPE